MADEVLVKNFKEFYQKIKPYLNGQVPTIANKFDKANLYSEDEKIVGRWLDGKPIYQKVVTGLNLEISETSFTNSGISATNIASIIKCVGFTSNGTYFDGLMANTYGGGSQYSTIAIQTTRNSTGIVVNSLLIQYTKTTDTAIAIGSDTDYSSTEKIIGTWIDGSPIYQITVPVSGDYTSTGTWMTLFAAPTGASGIINGCIFLGSGVIYPTLAIIGGYVKLNGPSQIGGMFNCTIQYIKAAS